MNTTENNKLIAEFMGRTKTFDIVDNDTYRGEVTLSKGLTEEQIEHEISHFEDRYSVTSIAIEENLQYNNSWDWLMPVIKKIKLMGVDLDTWKMITNPSDYEIENVHNQVVQFINQLNNQQL